MKRSVKLFLIVSASLLFSVAACATTSVVVTGVAPSFNAVPGSSCFASADTLRDLKEIVLEGRVTGTGPWSVLKRGPAQRGASFTFFVSSIVEALWDFRATAFDSTGNASCPDSVIGFNAIRNPAKTTGLTVTAP